MLPVFLSAMADSKYEPSVHWSSYILRAFPIRYIFINRFFDCFWSGGPIGHWITTALEARIISGEPPQNAKSAADRPRILQSIRGKEKNEKEDNIEVNYLSLLYESIVKKKSV